MITARLQQRLARLAERREELARLLSEPHCLADPRRYKTLSREYAQLQALERARRAHEDCAVQLEQARAMAREPDPELRALAEAEVDVLLERAERAEAELLALLVPADPLDQHNVFLEVRAGTGGDEAALFAGDLLRMYLRYAESRGWQVEPISASPGEHGGYKEVIVRIEGEGVYSRMKYESGTHRVQRVPVTESQGRIHTSACTVAILPELDEVDDIEIPAGELRIDTFRASGAGGQHVNKTDSAIRITHLPSGLVVECQDERSQHKNRARAMALLKARLLEAERERQRSAQTESRRLQVGTGDRSQRIRTYNFPQGRLTDHRINLTLYRLEEILAGDLDAVIEPLRREQLAEELRHLA